MSTGQDFFALSGMGDEPYAYAKLWGKNEEKEVSLFITSLPVILGRAGAHCAQSEEAADGKPAFLSLGTNKGISRRHALIEWMVEDEKYVITCLGRNGMTVGGRYCGPDTREVIESNTPLRLGSCMLYFLLPDAFGEAAADEEEDTQSVSSKTSSSYANKRKRQGGEADERESSHANAEDEDERPHAYPPAGPPPTGGIAAAGGGGGGGGGGAGGSGRGTPSLLSPPPGDQRVLPGVGMGEQSAPKTPGSGGGGAAAAAAVTPSAAPKPSLKILISADAESSPKNMHYTEAIAEAFKSPEMEGARDDHGGLTLRQIVDWVVRHSPSVPIVSELDPAIAAARAEKIKEINTKIHNALTRRFITANGWRGEHRTWTGEVKLTQQQKKRKEKDAEAATPHSSEGQGDGGSNAASVPTSVIDAPPPPSVSLIRGGDVWPQAPP